MKRCLKSLRRKNFTVGIFECKNGIGDPYLSFELRGASSDPRCTTLDGEMLIELGEILQGAREFKDLYCSGRFR